jgi:hypothetical protein
MSASLCFHITSFLALVGWLLLILSPHRNVTLNWVRNGRLSLILSAIYIVAVGFALTEAAPGSGLGTLKAVRTFFSSDWGLLTGWVHYLAFDLLLGSRVVQEGQGRPRWLLSVILILICWWGPLGWFLSEVAKRKVKDSST